jgi:hypothetical protein
MSEQQFSEEEIRAIEAEMEKLTVDDVLLQTVVTLLNLGARKAGLAEGSTADLPQVKMAVDAARALLPLLESRHADELGAVRDALSRLQMAFVQLSGETPPPAEQPKQEPEGGPAQRSGRLWVPGQ